MIEYFLSKLVAFYYKCFPKYYFSMPEKSDANIYMVNITNGELKRMTYKIVEKKKYYVLGEVIKKKVAEYDVNCLPFYSISDKHAKIKAQKKFHEYNTQLNVQQN